MRERFDSEYIHSELERLGDQLEAPLTVYLIGGGSMAFRDLKETTKDIDLVVTDGDALRQLQVALLACGYEIVRDRARSTTNSAHNASSRTTTDIVSTYSTGKWSTSSSSPRGCASGARYI